MFEETPGKTKPKTSLENKRKSKKDFRDKYFIKDIESLTGIRAYTLRIWEQRYELLVPKRTDTNIRYYEEDDLKYLMNIALLNQHGYKISRIAGMSRDEVQRHTLFLSENSSSNQSQIQGLTQAMMNFEEREFTKILTFHIMKSGMEDTMMNIVFPFLKHVGVLWLSGSIHVAHEHFITNLVKQRLYASIDQLAVLPSARAKKFLLFLPSNENHELPLLFANYMLRSRGHKVVYLGSSVMIEDLYQIYKLHEPDAVFTALTTTNPKVPVEVFVQTLVRNFPGTDIILTGSQILMSRDLKPHEQVHVLSDPQEFIDLLDSRWS